MSRFPLILIAIALCGVTQAQPIQTWPRFLDVTVNTAASGGGANVPSNVANFPLLIRLDSSNAPAVFAEALSGGADLRFASEGGAEIPHEIESWSATRANIWVRVPAVAGNGTTKVRLYWGKTGVSSTSSGAAVFDTTAGFTGVWHLNEGNGDTTVAVGAGASANASSYGSALNFTRHAGNTSATGISGFARYYNRGFADSGNNAGSMNSYRTDTIANNAQFQAREGVPITMSLWVNRRGGTNGATGLFGHFRYSAGNYRSYTLLRNADGYRVLISTGGTGDDINVVTGGTWPAGSTNYQWHHVTGTISPVDGVRLYVNGVEAATNTDPAQPFYPVTQAAARPMIGALERNYSQRFIGLIDEVRLSNGTLRNANWVKLDYETQKPGATAVTVGSAQSNDTARVFFYPVKNASYTQTVTIATNTPYVKAGNTVSGYSISPSSLPAGLAFNGTTGAISGTPTAVTASSMYIVTAVIDTLQYKDTLTITVSAGSAPSAPGNVGAVAGNALATVTWAAPSSAGTSAITSYVVRAVEDTAKICTWTTGALTCNVTGLTNGTSYTFTVRAVNSFGMGPASTASTAVVPAGAPSAPLNVVAAQAGTAASATVSWSAPASNGGQPVSDYYVTAAPGGQQCYSPPITNPTCTVTGLTYGTAYTFTVVAANSMGNGPASAPSNTMTPVGILDGSFRIQVTGSAKPFVFALTPEAMRSTEALTMTISDLHGRTVWTKTVNPKSDRLSELRWNATSSTGRAVSAGVYLVRVSATSGGQTSTFIHKAVSDR